jgi:hypothetical protein
MSQIDKAIAKVQEGAGAGMNAGEVAYIPAPRFIWADEHFRMINGVPTKLGYDGQPIPWDSPASVGGNVVVNLGAAHLINVFFGSTRVSTAGCFLNLHSATTASGHLWNSISASQVASYGNNVPLLTFATVATLRSASATAQYIFSAGTQTVSGACVQLYTTNTMSTNAATVDVLQYSEGVFANTRQVIGQAGASDTLNVTVTITYGT